MSLVEFERSEIERIATQLSSTALDPPTTYATPYDANAIAVPAAAASASQTAHRATPVCMCAGPAEIGVCPEIGPTVIELTYSSEGAQHRLASPYRPSDRRGTEEHACSGVCDVGDMTAQAKAAALLTGTERLAAGPEKVPHESHLRAIHLTGLLCVGSRARGVRRVAGPGSAGGLVGSVAVA